MADVQIIARLRSGMRLDAGILQTSISALGHRASVESVSSSIIQRMLTKTGMHRLQRRQARLNVFVQGLGRWWLPQARSNVLIPNQEWFHRWHRELLPEIDEVWCKSQAALRAFESLGSPTRFLGFTSRDCFRADHRGCARNREFLHVGSKSLWKGSRLLADVWKRHPEWPSLTLICRTLKDDEDLLAAKNIRLISAYIEEQELERLRNTAWFYIHPTEMEGYGHAIAEAMSVGAVVLTTDAPPMNELVTPERGVLMGPSSSEAHHLGERFFVSEASLTASVERVLGLSESELDRIGQAARAWFHENDRRFRVRLAELLDSRLANA